MQDKHQPAASRPPPTGTWPTTPACALTRNQTSHLSVPRLALNPLSHTGQGENFFKKKASPGQVALVVGASRHSPKGCGVGQSTCPGSGFDAGRGTYWRQPIDVSLFISLPYPLSKIKNKKSILR